MTEQLLQYIWKYRLFDAKGLTTLDGEAVEITKTGEQNHNSGADFSNARLKIGNTLWAGNVEIEIESANWQRHGHHTDASHQNTLLLVCLHHNAKQPIHIPVIELHQRINPKLISNYNALMSESSFIPCQKFIGKVDGFTLQSWLLRILAERLEQKVEPITTSLQNNNNNWEESFYHALARNFGFNTNAVPFELVAKSLPLNTLAKHKNNLAQLEALFLGQAGLLQNIDEPDAYTQKLQQEYSFLAKKFALQPINHGLWKFSKTRPANFPTLRLAQFAALVHTSTHLFSKLMETPKPAPLKKLFTIKASAYWDEHYRPSVAAQTGKNMLGEDAVNNILINTVAPFFFAYGLKKGEDDYKYRAMGLLEALPKEDNRIIRGYEELGLAPANAADGQALLQLHKHWCTPKKCLGCRIGHRIIAD